MVGESKDGLLRMLDVDMFTFAHKCMFYDKQIMCCGKVFPDEQVAHEHCLKTSLPRSAEIV